ncbi:hypothetical protein D3C78_1567270 [compost metagenome]
MIDGSSVGLLITSFGTLYLGSLGGNVQFQGGIDFTTASNVYGITMSRVDGLQAALLNKVSYGTATSQTTGGAHNHGFPNGAQFKDVNGVVYTWSAYNGFTHSHTV